MRNREIGVLATGLMALTAAGTIAGFVWKGNAPWVCLILGLLVSAWALAFTWWRYQKIKELSAALAAAAANGQVLDMRTNREGELSILRNDIYKVTASLAGQADHLRADKVFLAEALGDISHQLKTPLTSLLVHSDLLQEDNLPPEKRREFLQSISSQLERMRWLVSSLLKLSRVDAAIVEFRREEIHLSRLLSKAVEPLLPLAEGRGVSLRVDCSRRLTWRGDEDWTREAVGNLVKNCLEHAAPGGLVTIRCVDNPLHTLLVVEDDGPGFKAEDLPRLFERFYRGKNAGGEGVGIGLAMAKSILQAQRAELAAENRAEGGARFSVRLHE